MTTNSYLLSTDISLEEEENSNYDFERLYPARVEEVVQRNQTVSKLVSQNIAKTDSWHGAKKPDIKSDVHVNPLISTSPKAVGASTEHLPP